ncbi:hypothetical protein PFMALIP_02832 [Plasmodium falciparum MaliPS096_E11]|uniref:Uncharacterized protein n=1 Tax=Plasmodium falciparum MaliPS096_E11 TaxID=1036727 RepID=A0A024WQY3_PLAFA|nr:hypothetical protein PFMALIP_02832 [Plasmodium falciparum MaliPS096_E11]
MSIKVYYFFYNRVNGVIIIHMITSFHVIYFTNLIFFLLKYLFKNIKNKKLRERRKGQKIFHFYIIYI